MLAALSAATMHTLGVLLIAALLLLPYVTTDAFGLYAEAFSDGAFVKGSLQGIALHLGLSASLWALGVILFRLWGLRRTSTPKLIRAARGAVFVETLVVIVPFLLLTSGIAQMAMLNVTGVLAHLASYQATRTAWVWQPEAQKGRFGVNNSQVQRRARLAAAAVMAPSAPSAYMSTVSPSDTEFRDLRGTMVAAFLPAMPSVGTGRTTAQALAMGGKFSTSENLVFADAFDNEYASVRAARKLTYAYAATEVTVNQGGNDVSTTLTYKQHIVFPWFAYLWGTPGSVAGRVGYFTTLKRTYSLPKQVQL
jgi:hypothetical protein